MKKIATCPVCGRDVNDVDDVKEVGGQAYHEECAPTEAPAPVKPAEGGKKVKVDKDALLRQLVEKVGELSQQVAELKQGRSAPATRQARPKSEKGQPRPNVYYVVRGFPSDKRPPQCIRVYRALAQAAPAPAEGEQHSRMTELDVWNALMAEPFPSTKPNPRLGAWNHVQTPYYIFKYYRADMINAEFVAGPFDV